MEVVTGAMGTLLPKLAGLLTEEYQLQKKAKGEIKFLTAELESMQTFLLKVSEAPIDQPPDIQVQLWAREVRELSYDLEDNIDKFMVRVDTPAPKKPHSFMGFIDRSLNLMKNIGVRRKIGLDIKNIKTRIKEVSERRERYKVDNIVAKTVGPTIDSLRLSALHKEVTKLVGVQENSEYIVNKLMEEDNTSGQQLKIVSIVGFGGLGKTTLANVVYQKLKEQFDCGAFVSISLNPDMVKILKNILDQVGKKFIGQEWDEVRLIGELREFLTNKRYFIVIDDIWNKSVWKRIKYALVENERGSRIVTTTRNLDVAEQAGGVYQLKPLSADDSTKLFYLGIFGSEDKYPPNQLAEVSKNILKKCGGVPLAIITIASMLASKKGNEPWYWSEVYRSMGSGIGGSLDVKDMRRILSVSYYDLPPHLRTCLLYLSSYPEDYEIDKDELIWRWIGEGFVQKEQGKSLSATGGDYFVELINKSLIQPIQTIGYYDRMSVSACQVHDMVLDLITCLSKEENFLTTLRGQQYIPIQDKVRRLSLQSSNEDAIKQMPAVSLSHVRSIILFNSVFSLLPDLSRFPVLRVLDLSDCDQVENHHVQHICSLFHLRYLNLARTYITEIPTEIKNLQFLQVLNIVGNEIEEIPSTFVQLGQLVYLNVDYDVRLPEGFGNLKNLEDLTITIHTQSATTMLHDLGRLTKLRYLDITFEEWDERYKQSFLKCLANFTSLETLQVDGLCGRLDLVSDSLSMGHQRLSTIELLFCTVHAVPRWWSSLSSLSKISIRLERLGEGDLEVLGIIPSLNDLFIVVEEPTMDRDERLVIGSDKPFQCLTEFTLRAVTTEVVFAQGAMQKLIRLRLGFEVRKTINQFGDVDLGLENLCSLEHAEVVLRECSKAMPGDVEAVEAAVRQAIDMNPNNPTLKLNKLNY